MSQDMVRWGGLAGVVAGVMFLVSGILYFIVAPPLPTRPLGSFGDYLYEVVVAVAFVLVLVTIAGLHAAQRLSGRYGILGTAGFSLTFVGYAIVLVIAHLFRLVGGEYILSLRLVGGLLVLIGSILLGALTIRTGVLPWWCGVLLIVGFPLGALLENVRAGIENIVFAVVWGLIGYVLLSRRSTVAEQPPSRVS